MESGTTSTDPARCLPIDGLTWAAHGIRSAHQAPCAPVGTKRDRRVIGLIRKPEPWLSVGARSMDASTCSLAAVLWSTTYGCRLGTAPVASSMARGMPCSSPRTMLRAESYVLMGRRAGAQPLERPSISIRRTKARCVRACSTSMEFVTTPTLRASGKRDGSKPPERGITWIPRAGSCAPVGLPWAVLGTISILRRGLCRPVGCRRAVIGIT